jgi:hypothetical protein
VSGSGYLQVDGYTGCWNIHFKRDFKEFLFSSNLRIDRSISLMLMATATALDCSGTGSRVHLCGRQYTYVFFYQQHINNIFANASIAWWPRAYSLQL